MQALTKALMTRDRGRSGRVQARRNLDGPQLGAQKKNDGCKRKKKKVNRQALTNLAERARHRWLVLWNLRPTGDGVSVRRPGLLLGRGLSKRKSVNPPLDFGVPPRLRGCEGAMQGPVGMSDRLPYAAPPPGCTMQGTCVKGTAAGGSGANKRRRIESSV